MTLLLDFAILIFLIVNCVLTFFTLRASWRSVDAVTDPALGDAVALIAERFNNLDVVLDRVDRASVGAQLAAQGLAIDLHVDRQRAIALSARVQEQQDQADAVPDDAEPGKAADAAGRGPDHG